MGSEYACFWVVFTRDLGEFRGTKVTYFMNLRIGECPCTRISVLGILLLPTS